MNKEVAEHEESVNRGLRPLGAPILSLQTVNGKSRKHVSMRACMHVCVYVHGSTDNP